MAAPLHRPARLFLTDDILSGRIAMDAYPLRYICIGAISYGGFAPEQIRVGPGSARSNAAVDQLLSTVELLESQGWELVSVYESGTQACLRRRTAR
jgi:hypothetical protein